MRMKKIFAIICLCCGLSMTAAAQCGIENTAFKSGELLSYDLYFNWKFIWMKVGSAEMDTRLSKFDGQEAWKSYLITRGNPKLDKYFMRSIALMPTVNSIGRPQNIMPVSTI